MWKDLSLKDKSALMLIMVNNGIYDLSTIRDTYNKYAEGGKKDSLNKSESIELKVSTAIMNLIHRGKLKLNVPSETDLTRDGGVAQRTYLLNREDLKKEFLNAGYIEGKEGDYGLVRKAVGNRDIPIYQREPDAAKREDLVPIGNINNIYYPEKGELIHAGNFPTALYYNYQDNKLYLKAWDLNDYGGNTGYAKNYSFLQKLGTNILDKIGSPTVVTSGFLEIPKNIFLTNYNLLAPFLENFYKSKGLEYDFLVDPYKDTPTPHLPEIVITNKSKKYAEGGEKNSNDNWTMLDEVNYRTWRNELPDNLKYTNNNEYDMRGAYKAGMTPLYIKEDNSYHLGSRDPLSGKILKAPHHPTFLKALITDASMGYYPSTDNKGNTYTTTWIGNKFEEGGYVRELNNNPIAFDKEGNLVDLVTGEKGTMMLPEVTIRGISPETRAKNYSSTYYPEDALEFFDIMTRPLTRPFSTSLLIGAIRNKINGGTYLGSLLGNEENLGIVSRNFNKEHPYLSTAANIGVDILTPSASKLSRFTPTRIRQGIYNNVVPGSYSASYMGSKRKEFKLALTDILSGNTIEDNPKWKEWMELPNIYGEFKYTESPKLAALLRMEAWKKSLGLPHKDKYLLKTGKVDANGRPVVTYNLEEIPLEHLQNFINEVNRNKTVIPDYIGNTGGYVLASKKDGIYRLEDLWDVLPFLNPNREGVLPKAIKNKMTNRIETPNGKYPYKLEWKSWVPKWFINLDPTEIVGKGPFRNITELKPTKLSDNLLFYKKPLLETKDRLKLQYIDLLLELFLFEDIDPTEAGDIIKNVKLEADKFIDNVPLETLERYRLHPYSPKELLDKYGLFTIQ